MFIMLWYWFVIRFCISYTKTIIVENIQQQFADYYLQCTLKAFEQFMYTNSYHIFSASNAWNILFSRNEFESKSIYFNMYNNKNINHIKPKYLLTFLAVIKVKNTSLRSSQVKKYGLQIIFIWTRFCIIYTLFSCIEYIDAGVMSEINSLVPARNFYVFRNMYFFPNTIITVIQ